MATSASPQRELNEEDNPGQEYYDDLVGPKSDGPDDVTSQLKDRENLENPDTLDNQAAGDASDPRSPGSNLGSESSLYKKPDNGHELSKMKPTAAGIISFAKTNRGRIILGGAGAGIVTLLIIGFFALLPFKILHIVNNLQSHFFATSENAVSKETDVMFSNYLKKYVLPGITNCKGTIDKTCTPKTIAGNGLVSRLYKGWSSARLENTLAEKYGLEFSYHKSTGHYFMKTTDLTGEGVDLGTAKDPNGFIESSGSLDDYLAKSSDPQFKQASRSQIRQAVKDSLSQETRFKQVMYRFKVGRLLEEKYGIKRCIIACTAQDNFSEWKNQKRIAAKAMIAQRILQPRGQMIGLVIECLIDPSCDPANTSKLDTTGECTPGVDCEANGEDRSTEEKTIQSKLDELAAKYGSEDILKLYNELEEKGFTQFTIEQVLAGILDEETAQAAGQTADKALPIVGWINLASQVVGNINTAPAKIEKLNYIVNTSTMVASFAMYRTYADEIKTGSVDSTIVGSFTDTLSRNSASGMGGTAEAEQTPLYSRLLGNGKNSGSSDYKCNDGKPVPAGESTCPELQLNNTNSIASAIQNIKSHIPFFREISGLATLWNSTFGKVINIFGSLINYIIPQLGEAVGSVVDKVAGPIIQAISSFIIPPIVSDNMSGGRVFDVMAGGADVSGNDYAHHGLGGQELSGAQAAAILDEQQQEYNNQHSHGSVFARVFDTNSENSLVTRLVMAVPSSPAELRSSVASMLAHPLKGFASTMSFGHAQAAGSQSDPFGITQYGYPVSDSAFTTDPETFWDNNCSSDGTTIDPNLPINKAYHALSTSPGGSVIINPDTQMPENTTTDPCYLIQAAVGSDGAFYDSSLLTQDDTSGQ